MPVSPQPPRRSGAGESAPVYEVQKRTAFGMLHLRRYRCDADPACFGGLAPVVRLWQGKRRGEGLPCWRDFAMADFVGWHRNVALSDLGTDGDPRFRLFGSGMAEVMGRDLTGRCLSESFPSAGPDGVLAHFDAIRRERLIGLLAGNVGKAGHEHRIFKVVELPLGNDAGEVGQVLHACISQSGRE